jgi:predicted nuclease with TOPRIM domain
MNVIKNLFLKFFHRFIVASYIEEIEEMRNDLNEYIEELKEERETLKDKLAYLEVMVADKNDEIFGLRRILQVFISKFVLLDQPLSHIEKQWSSFHENQMDRYTLCYGEEGMPSPSEDDIKYYHEFIMGDGKLIRYFQQRELDLLKSLSDWPR